jgi:anhydro-N-acetylmuramic acid kinase
MKKQLVLGIMSGTSIDSVDYALCEIDSHNVILTDYWQVEFPGKLRQRLHAAAKGIASSWEAAQLHHDLGRFYAVRARDGLGTRRPALAGLHGQTIFHNPDLKAPATLQLGEPAYLAEALGVPVIGNFRAADMAAGGQGAPLATLFHLLVFGRSREHVCVNNLGGISNVTSIDWRRGGRRAQILSFDTGPANMLVDLAVRHLTGGRRHFDKDGAWAARGKANETLLAKWMRHPFFKKKPPKSTGRELFGEPFFRRAITEMEGLPAEDVVRTLTMFTARSLAMNYRLHLPGLPDRLILAGGGAANPVLVRAISNELGQLSSGRRCEIRTAEEMGWPSQAIEPAAFALLAWRRAHGKAGNLPDTTGASRPVLCGQVAEPGGS